MQASVDFLYHTAFSISDEQLYVRWLTACATMFDADSIDLAIAFMDDEALHALNLTHLNHDTYTDIITFDDSVGKEIVVNIAISVERVKANAKTFSQTFDNELLRVISHGLLHCLGFSDKTVAENEKMKGAEDSCIKLFHAEHKFSNDVS